MGLIIQQYCNITVKKPGITLSESSKTVYQTNTFKLNADTLPTRACSHKNSIKNHSKHDNRKKNNIEFIVTSADFSKTL